MNESSVGPDFNGFDRAAVILLELDTDGRVRHINRRGAEILGYRPADLLNKDWFRNCLPRSEIAEQTRADFLALLKRDQSGVSPYVNSVRCRDDSALAVSWQSTLIRDEAQRIAGVMSFGLPLRGDSTAPDAKEAGLGEFQERLDTLTKRERDVFERMLAGRNTKEIAFDLDIGVKTVETHRSRIMNKLQVDSQMSMIRLMLVMSGLPMPERCLIDVEAIPKTARASDRAT